MSVYHDKLSAGRYRPEKGNDLTGRIQYSGQIPWSITGRGIGDGWFPADTVLDEDVRDALRDGSLSISGRRH